MATSPGWAQLGSQIAGGGKLPAALAYDQGEALGARTADALAQARERVNKNAALENLDEKLKQFLPDDTERAGAVAAAQAGIPLEQLSGFRNQNFTYGQRKIASDPTQTDDARAGALFGIGSNDQVIRPVGEFQSTNVLHPSAGVAATDLGSQLAAGKIESTAAAADSARSSAALHRDQVAHPEKYRIVPTAAAEGSDGSQPIQQETYAQLVAQGLAPMPTAGRALIQMGGEDFARRANFLAGQRNGAPPPVVGASPPAAGAPGTAPPTGGIQLPTEKPAKAFSANLDVNSYGVRRTALNDLSRKNGTGGNDDALNRTAGHLDVYEQLMRNSGNSNFVPGNELKNWFQQNTGKAFPKNAALAAHILGTEIVKSMTSVGAGTGEERLGLSDTFKNANSIDQAAGAIETAERLLREQAVATNQRVGSAGVKDYYKTYLTPTARRRLKLDETPAAAPDAGGAADNDPLGLRK